MVPATKDNPELYRDDQSSVTPSWLINGKSRYAVRTLVKLEYHKISKPKTRAGTMLLVGAVLTALSIRYILIGAQPAHVPLIMLAGSVTLLLGSGCALYLARPRFRIDMMLLDGSCVSLRRKRQVDAEGLLGGLSRAIDWHRRADPDAQCLTRGRRLRKNVARSPGRKISQPARVVPAPAPAPDSPGQRGTASPVVAVDYVNLKERVAPMLALLSMKRYRRPAD